MNRITQPRTGSARRWYPLRRGGYGPLVPISPRSGRGPGWGWLRESGRERCLSARGPGWDWLRESDRGQSLSARGPGWGWLRESGRGRCLSARGPGWDWLRESDGGQSRSGRGRTMTRAWTPIHRALRWARRRDERTAPRQSESEGTRTGQWRESRQRTIR
jgi:hypothetical protein